MLQSTSVALATLYIEGASVDPGTVKDFVRRKARCQPFGP